MTKNNGFISKPIAKIINIGVKVATVAVFELSSVKKIINKPLIISKHKYLYGTNNLKMNLSNLLTLKT